VRLRIVGEIERLRVLGKGTIRVVEDTLRFLRGAKVNGRRVSYKSKPLSVGTVKKVIGRSLSSRTWSRRRIRYSRREDDRAILTIEVKMKILFELVSLLSLTYFPPSLMATGMI